MRGLVIPALGLAILLSGSLAADCFETPNSRSEEAVATDDAVHLPTFFPSPAPSPSWMTVLWSVARTEEDAAGFAREKLYESYPPFHTLEVTSLKYTTASVGAGREIFGYTTDTWETPDDVPAVLLVATGVFECYGNRFTDDPDPQYSTFWVIVPLGEKGATRADCTNESYDLSSLGDVRQVPLPLADFPAPVSLD